MSARPGASTVAARPAAKAEAPAFPRLLFITPCAFNKETGGGVTFTNLFKGWPRDRIATVHDDAVPVSTEVCERYYRLGDGEIRRWRPGRLLGPGPAPAGPGEAGAARAQRPVRSVLDGAKELVFGDGLPQRGRLSPELERWIEAFEPQVLYTILGGNGLMEIVDRVRRRFRLPLVVHMMDDWPRVSFRRGLLAPFQRRRMEGLVAALIGDAALCLGICQAMCRDYALRYARPFEPFQNTVDVARWAPTAKRDLSPDSPVRLVYTGSVLPSAQVESLVECCRAVRMLCEKGFPVRLDIYSPPGQTAPIQNRLLAADAVRLHGTIGEDEAYFRMLAAADILLLPANFDARSAAHVRLSMPTKVPSYLVSGTPVLVYGPPGIAQVDDAAALGWGHVVGTPGPEAVAEGIERLATDRALRRRLSETAKGVAAERHDAARVRARFQARLAEAARAAEAAPSP